MNDDVTAQSSSSNHYDATQNQNQQGVTGQQPQQPVSPPVKPAIPPQQPSVTPHKEFAPVSEHMQVTDAVEAKPELHPEVKEHGVEVKTDEAHLELTREQQQAGVQHSPQSQPVKPVVNEEQKPEFPLTYIQAETEAKKASVIDSLKWLAVYVLRQMKIKNLSEENIK